MLIYGVDETGLNNVAAMADVRIVDYRKVSKNAARFRLGLLPVFKKIDNRWCSPWQRLNHRLDRKVGAVCWHGHKRFFELLFEAFPAARVKTTRLRNNPTGDRAYTAENFGRLYKETGYTNIGSMFEPCEYKEACEYDSHTERKKEGAA